MELPLIPTPYERLGGEPAVRKLVDRFYDHMDAQPEMAAIRDMHPADLRGSRDKLYKFLSGWLGGPRIYDAEFGHPRLRLRHFPFPIGPHERDLWLRCMEQALVEVCTDPTLRQTLYGAFTQVATHLINQGEAGAEAARR